MASLLYRYQELIGSFHTWRQSATMPVRLLLIAAGALLTGLMSQAVVYLPWTPVPITGQTLAVLLCAVLLGPWAAVSQVLYAVLGIAGVPWFAGGRGGMAVLAGPTTGYLIGFVLAAGVAGYCLERWPRLRRLVSLTIFLALINAVAIFMPGLAGLYIWLAAVKGTAPSLTELLTMGLFPFIPGALVKTLLAALAGRALLPLSRLQ